MTTKRRQPILGGWFCRPQPHKCSRPHSSYYDSFRSCFWKWFTYCVCLPKWVDQSAVLWRSRDVRFIWWFRVALICESIPTIAWSCFFHFRHLSVDRGNLSAYPPLCSLPLPNPSWKKWSCRLCFNVRYMRLDWLPCSRSRAKESRGLCFSCLWSAGAPKNERLRLYFQSRFCYRIW